MRGFASSTEFPNIRRRGMRQLLAKVASRCRITRFSAAYPLLNYCGARLAALTNATELFMSGQAPSHLDERNRLPMALPFGMEALR